MQGTKRLSLEMVFFPRISGPRDEGRSSHAVECWNVGQLPKPHIFILSC